MTDWMERRAKLLARGMCPSHAEGTPVVQDRAMCQTCLDAASKRAAKRYKRHKRAGKCNRHPARDVVPGRTRCQECLDYGIKSGTNRRKRLKKTRKCVHHSKRNAVTGKTQCQACLDRLRGPQHAVYDGVRRSKENLAPYEPVDTRVVFERDNWTCQHCRKTVNGDAAGDHIVPISVGGPHMYWNHQTLCKSCNSVKHNDVRKEPRLAHLAHLPAKELIEAFAKQQGATLPRNWWSLRRNK